MRQFKRCTSIESETKKIRPTFLKDPYYYLEVFIIILLIYFKTKPRGQGENAIRFSNELSFFFGSDSKKPVIHFIAIRYKSVS